MRCGTLMVLNEPSPSKGPRKKAPYLTNSIKVDKYNTGSKYLLWYRFTHSVLIVTALLISISFPKPSLSSFQVSTWLLDQAVQAIFPSPGPRNTSFGVKMQLVSLQLHYTKLCAVSTQNCIFKFWNLIFQQFFFVGAPLSQLTCSLLLKEQDLSQSWTLCSI